MLLKDLPIGAKVVDNDTKYLGEPIVWLVADKNHKGYPSNSVTLITKNIISLKAVDAKEPKNINFGRDTSGNNYYKVSNIHGWLHGNGSWYRDLHVYDAPPKAENLFERNSAYDKESGFLTGFSKKLKNALMSSTLITYSPHADNACLENIYAGVFLASATEVGLRSTDTATEGEKLALFSGDSSRKAYLTAEAVEQSKNLGYQTKSDIPWNWWLRSPSISNSFCVHLVGSNGVLGENSAFICSGIRPLCNVNENIEVFDKPNSNGAYEMKGIKPPSNPNGITIPDRIRSGKQAIISWGTATDPDGDKIEYGLDRKVDNNNWSRIYKGIDKEYTDNIIKGWDTVGYRVAAYDNRGGNSGYVTSEIKKVINNADPEILTPVNSNLGLKTGPFDIIYTIMNEEEEQSLTVNKYFDGKLIMKCEARRGQEIKDSITEYDWQMILNGEHKFKIEVRDSEGGTAEKVFTFSKNETSILLELKKPLEADDRVTKAIINVGRVIPDGAEMRIEVCNNAFDDKPTWQDVTRAVLNNSKIFIANETKTADKWGVNIRVAVDRNNATGDCFISSIGGVFE